MVMVSVVIPVFNRESVLERTIKSLQAQTFMDFEMIFVDDGSTDNSGKVICNYAEKDGRIRYFYQENRGVSSARNKGIYKSLGRFISFLDSDDTWNSDFLMKMISGIQGSSVCYCGANNVKNNMFVEDQIKFKSGNIFEDYIKNICSPNMNSWMIERKIILDNQIFFENEMSWGEDRLFIAKLLLNYNDVKVVPEHLTNYYTNSEESLSKNELSKIDQDLIWIKKLIVYISKNPNVTKIKRKKYIEILQYYRWPGAVIYRLLNNIGMASKQTLHDYYNYFKPEVKYINGLRSIKLKFLQIKLYFYIKK